jgi:type I restriction enzyme, S subunit
MNNRSILPLDKCLSRVIDYRGKTPKKLGCEWSKTGYRAISANNVKSDGLVKLDSINYVDEALYEKWMKEEILKGDLLLTSEAPSGQVMLWDSEEKIVLSQRLFALRTNELIYNKYLKYYLQSKIGQREIQRNNSGSTVSGISAKIFSNILIRFPHKDLQCLIGDFLYSLDKKIELNNRINAELEAMAKTLYDYWFVQFDFPNEEGKPYKSSGGKMVYNTTLKREIPEGWSSIALQECMSLVRGVTYDKEQINKGDLGEIGLLRSTNITDNKIDLNDLVSIHNDFVSKAQIIEQFDILIVMSSGSKEHIGKNGFYYFKDKVTFGAFCSKLAIKKEYLFYINNFLNSKWFKTYIKYQCLGTNINNLTNEHINKCQVLKPDEKQLKLFEENIFSNYEKIANNSIQNESLRSLRDFLLPMLMNGQVTVK